MPPGRTYFIFLRLLLQPAEHRIEPVGVDFGLTRAERPGHDSEISIPFVEGETDVGVEKPLDEVPAAVVVTIGALLLLAVAPSLAQIPRRQCVDAGRLEVQRSRLECGCACEILSFPADLVTPGLGLGLAATRTLADRSDSWRFGVSAIHACPRGSIGLEEAF